jgi:GNAT superfamily N-acetyltransferase
VIRPATLADMDALIALGRQMHAEGTFRHVVLDEDKVRATFERLIAEHFLAVNDGPEGIDGGLAGMLTEFWFSRERLACDLAFFVRPSRRGSIAAVRLVQAFVAWAQEQGAAEVSISQSSGVRIEETNRLLTGMGFAYVGGVYKWRFANV